MEAPTGQLYLSDLHGKLSSYFNLEEIRTICFGMGVDYDSLPGEGKAAKARELIYELARKGRLQELVDRLRIERRHVAWADPPADLELPQAAAAGSSGSTTNIYNIDTGGGAYIPGTVQTSGGAFVGRDQVVQGDIVQGSQVNISGSDFRGAILNINSQLDNVTQTIQAMPSGDPDQKVQLTALIAEMKALLAQTPPEQAADAELVARRLENLAEEAAADAPDPELVQTLGQSLRKAASKFSNSLPGLIDLSAAVVNLVQVVVS